jgi:ATPase involved in DNA replication initiation
MADRQLVLDLTLPEGRDPDDFLISDANREAVHWLECWRRWPAPALILYGPPGCGKSHLVSWFRGHTQAKVIAPASIDVRNDGIFAAAAGMYIVEDADRADEAAEEPLLHLYNVVAAGGGRLLLTARVPPRDWPVRLPDLRSRLQAAPTAAILAPDDTLLGAILIKLFRDRQLAVDDDVVSYLLPRIERSFDALPRIVDCLDRSALAARRRLTVPFVRAVLQEHGSLDRG